VCHHHINRAGLEPFEDRLAFAAHGAEAVQQGHLDWVRGESVRSRCASAAGASTSGLGARQAALLCRAVTGLEQGPRYRPLRFCRTTSPQTSRSSAGGFSQSRFTAR